MAVDMFLKIQGYAGESEVRNHENEIEVLSFSWGHNDQGQRNFKFVHKVDRSSPKLLTAFCDNTQIPKGTLKIRKAGTKPLEYLKYTFSDFYVKEIDQEGGNGVPHEAIVLEWVKVEIDYMPINDGGLGAEQHGECQAFT
jgi:type VI secretion system secreted protein Hcp